MFEQVDPKVDFNKLEQEVLEYWRRSSTFQKVQELRKDGKPFVFFEGPPTANAAPGFHHVETRAFKDLIPRYQTMRGRRVDRKAGWDTHGLPVELQVEKKLGLKNKKEIEAYGIAKFNEECRKDVWSFKEAWEKLTERIGFWLDLEQPYITYENSYIESVWAILKHVSTQKDPLGRPMLYLGHKVVPYCTRCGTALSSHEVAQGYKNVTDQSVYVKFKIKNLKLKIPADKPAYILAWTTTPWTLPGNVALAIGRDIDYAVVEANKEVYILANDRLDFLRSTSYDLKSTLKGSDLVGLQYEPLFPNVIDDNGKAFRIYEADFVNTEDGTGVVHTAVMYGEDDYNLGVQVGLPTEHTVGEDGRFLSHVTEDLAGRYVKAAETEKMIIDSLRSRGLLLKSEPHAHDYPFCWRCDTALLYYARDSWFIRMSALRDEMIKRNNSVNWEPKSIKEGRMGEWLENAKDWAISRERYWGTPLPFWQCEEGHLTVVDSLQAPSVADREFYVMRHGESEKNVRAINSSAPERTPYHLTETGRAQAEKAAEQLENTHIDLIITSDLVRAKETAQIVHEQTGAEIIVDARLNDVGVGIFNDRPDEEYFQFLGGYPSIALLTKRPEGGENLDDVRARTVTAVREVLRAHPNKSILFISHADPLYSLETSLENLWGEEIIHDKNWQRCVKPGELRQLTMPNWPFNEKGEVDIHRPYIDDIEIQCEHCGKVAKRVKEVADVWLDSGSMPFAQVGYPQGAGSVEEFGVHYPADYISEAIDQTRGWFYTLLAVATLMGKEAPYKNVICLGHVLDEHGKKMSKSKGNIVDPWQLIEKYGADAVRFYFYSINPAGEPKLFNEKDLQTVQRRVLLLWWNVYSFFVSYSNEVGWTYEKGSHHYRDSENILDQWILARLNQTVEVVTSALDSYDALTASRSLADLIDDTSTWYLRRSRARFSATNADVADRGAAFATLFHVLVWTAKLMAPLTPFLSENMFMNLTGNEVHASNWPVAEDINQEVIEDMKIVRGIVSKGLEARMSAGIKVRQPLSHMVASSRAIESADWGIYSHIIINELNLHDLEFHPRDRMASALRGDGNNYVRAGEGDETIYLDTFITPELKREGMIRELIRAIQGARKSAGLSVADHATVEWQSDDAEVIQLFANHEILNTVSATTRSTFEHLAGTEGIVIDLNGHAITIALK